MSISITLKKTVPPIGPAMQSYDLTVEVTAATGMPQEVFVFKRSLPTLPAPPAQAQPADPVDLFISVADPVDLEEYPIGSPDMANSNPYFRTKIVTLRYRDLVDLEQDWVYINEDIQGLVDALKAATQPGSTEETTIS